MHQDHSDDNFVQDNFIYVSKKYKLAEGKNPPTNKRHKRKDKLKNYLHENYIHDLK